MDARLRWWAAMRELETRAKGSRRAIADEVNRRLPAETLDHRRISAWFPSDPQKGFQLPGEGNEPLVEALIDAWCARAGRPAGLERSHLITLLRSARSAAGDPGPLSPDLSHGLPHHLSPDVNTGRTCATAAAADPLDLGVHAVTSTDPAGRTLAQPLSAYYLRSHDRELRDHCTRIAAGDRPDASMLLVLLGDSAVGKSRAAYEALRATVPDRPLLVPADAEDLVRLLTAGAAEPGAVLWLNETQRFLQGQQGPVAAKLLLRHLTAYPGVIAIGNMWEKPYWEELTEPGGYPDIHHAARDLLTGPRTRTFRVPDQLGTKELKELGALTLRDGERALGRALEAGGQDGMVFQRLTGGPELVETYAGGGRFTPTERSLITASLDARRLGHRSPFTPAFLADCADGYLRPAQRPDDKGAFDAALTALAAGRRPDGSRTDIRRSVTALTAGRSRTGAPPVYEPDTYLMQHATHRPVPVPATCWDALVRHTTDVYDRVRLGHAAMDRGLRRIAVQLLEPTAEAGNSDAARAIADLLKAAHHDREAEYWRRRWRELTQDDEGVPYCSIQYARLRDDFGRALVRIDLLECPTPERWRRVRQLWCEWRPGLDTPPYGDRMFPPPWAPPQWPGWEWSEALTLAHLGNALAWSFDPPTRASQADLRELFLLTYESDNKTALDAEVHFGGIDLRSDERYWQELADGGDPSAARILARLHVLRGRTSAAMTLLRRFATWRDGPGTADVWWDLGRLMERAGRPEARRLCLEQAAGTGHLRARLGLLTDDGRGAEGEPLLREALEMGDPLAEGLLIDHLRAGGGRREAERLERYGIDPGGVTAAPW